MFLYTAPSNAMPRLALPLLSTLITQKPRDVSMCTRQSGYKTYAFKYISYNRYHSSTGTNILHIYDT